MQPLLTASTKFISRQKKSFPTCSCSFLGIHRWIPVLTLLVIRPFATLSFSQYPSFPLQRRPALSFHILPIANMPRMTRSTTSATSGATNESSIEVPKSRKREDKDGELTTKPSPKRKKATNKETPAPKKARGSTKKTMQDELEEVDDVEKVATTSPKKKKSVESATPKKGRAIKTTASKSMNDQSSEQNVTSAGNDSKTNIPKKKTGDHQRITERDPLPRLWNSQTAATKGSYTFRIASWNVAGLRALLKKYPTALADLCNEHDLDMLCLQETKLQESHLEDPKLKVRGCVPGYDEYWSCSTVKKGYSGTAVFVKQRHPKKERKQTNIGSFFAKKSTTDSPSAPKVESTQVCNVDPELVTPTDVSYELGKEIDNEGRTIILEYPFATVTNVYVPNSGQVLERLDYRTKEWDKEFLAFQQRKERERGLPVIWLGDLNIAHKAYDVWNDGATHLAKQAGVTEQERISFQEQLDAGYVDAFRKLHPAAKGHYSYWSQRAGNREPNKGLRLDYFICSPPLFSEDSPVIVRDSYMIPDRLGSDHAPVVLELELKNKD